MKRLCLLYLSVLVSSYTCAQGTPSDVASVTIKVVREQCSVTLNAPSLKKVVEGPCINFYNTGLLQKTKTGVQLASYWLEAPPSVLEKRLTQTAADAGSYIIHTNSIAGPYAVFKTANASAAAAYLREHDVFRGQVVFDAGYELQLPDGKSIHGKVLDTWVDNHK